LAEDSRANFTIWAGPIPLHWEAVHTNVSDQGFTDTQIKGPYQYWVHSHQFISISPETTEIIDEVSAHYGKGLFWGLVTRLMWLSMPFLFAYRSWRTRKALQGVS
jgi:ligand-binding SRPBCC domain-containing protein